MDKLIIKKRSSSQRLDKDFQSLQISKDPKSYFQGLLLVIITTVQKRLSYQGECSPVGIFQSFWGGHIKFVAEKSFI